jgi:hypothetical protein
LEQRLRDYLLADVDLIRFGGRWQLVEDREVILEWKDLEFPQAAPWISTQLELAKHVWAQVAVELQHDEQQRDNAKQPRPRPPEATSKQIDADIDACLDAKKTNPYTLIPLWRAKHKRAASTIRTHIRNRLKSRS